MESNNLKASVARLDWRWLIAAYCFFVLFQLTPTYYFLAPRHYFLQSIWEVVIWEGAGIAVVSIFVALRSRNTTILEPAFAAILYAITLTLMIQTHRETYLMDKGKGFVVAMWIFFFVVAFASAGFATLRRLRQDAKAPA